MDFQLKDDKTKIGIILFLDELKEWNISFYCLFFLYIRKLTLTGRAFYSKHTGCEWIWKMSMKKMILNESNVFINMKKKRKKKKLLNI